MNTNTIERAFNPDLLREPSPRSSFLVSSEQRETVKDRTKLALELIPHLGPILDETNKLFTLEIDGQTTHISNNPYAIPEEKKGVLSKIKKEFQHPNRQARSLSYKDALDLVYGSHYFLNSDRAHNTGNPEDKYPKTWTQKSNGEKITFHGSYRYDTIKPYDECPGDLIPKKKEVVKPDAIGSSPSDLNLYDNEQTLYIGQHDLENPESLRGFQKIYKQKDGSFTQELKHGNIHRSNSFASFVGNTDENNSPKEGTLIAHDMSFIYRGSFENNGPCYGALLLNEPYSVFTKGKFDPETKQLNTNGNSSLLESAAHYKYYPDLGVKITSDKWEQGWPSGKTRLSFDDGKELTVKVEKDEPDKKLTIYIGENFDRQLLIARESDDMGKNVHTPDRFYDISDYDSFDKFFIGNQESLIKNIQIHSEI